MSEISSPQKEAASNGISTITSIEDNDIEKLSTPHDLLDILMGLK